MSAAGTSLAHGAPDAPAPPVLWDKRLILVGGKGGVGRTTVAAAIAQAAAARGRRTLLMQANAADRVGALFGRAPLGTDLAELAPNLWGVNTTPATALAEYGLMILKFGPVYDMVFENRLTKGFLRAIPGLDDYAVLGKAWFHTTEKRSGGLPRFDTLVFDMPASGHSVSMLKIPQVIVETVPDGPLTRDARTLLELLRDPARTATVLVTLAEEMPVNEVRELGEKLGEQGIRITARVANQLYPNRFAPGSLPAQVLAAVPADVGPDLANITSHARLMASRAALAQRYLAELRAMPGAPTLELPTLFSTDFGPPQLAELSRLLVTQLA